MLARQLIRLKTAREKEIAEYHFLFFYALELRKMYVF